MLGISDTRFRTFSRSSDPYNSCHSTGILAEINYMLGGLPGCISASNNHPQSHAIKNCGWMGLLSLVMWAVASVWAYTRSKDQISALSQITEKDITDLSKSLRCMSEGVDRVSEEVASLSARGGQVMIASTT